MITATHMVPFLKHDHDPIFWITLPNSKTIIQKMTLEEIGKTTAGNKYHFPVDPKIF